MTCRLRAHRSVSGDLIGEMANFFNFHFPLEGLDVALIRKELNQNSVFALLQMLQEGGKKVSSALISNKVNFYVFNGLEERGIISATENVVFRALNDTKSVAKNCVPKILRFTELWQCLQNPPEYKPSAEEKALEESLEKSLSPNQTKPPLKDDPYVQ